MNAAEFERERERAGYSKARLAALLGVSRQTVIRWAQGDSPVSGPVAFAMRRLRDDEGTQQKKGGGKRRTR